ncbi:MAG TPA: FliG C-terminal domain-containing protein [Bacteroidales bacterium]|nr:FliG C-terminal domain-containing protein [Bacteroidales bacterium]
MKQRTKIKSKDIQFSDLLNISLANIRKIIGPIDVETIAIAIIGVEDEIKDVILSNMGMRKLAIYEKLDIDYSQIKQSDIIKARKIILERMKKLIS